MIFIVAILRDIWFSLHNRRLFPLRKVHKFDNLRSIVTNRKSIITKLMLSHLKQTKPITIVLMLQTRIVICCFFNVCLTQCTADGYYFLSQQSNTNWKTCERSLARIQNRRRQLRSPTIFLCNYVSFAFLISYHKFSAVTFFDMCSYDFLSLCQIMSMEMKI